MNREITIIIYSNLTGEELAVWNIETDLWNSTTVQVCHEVSGKIYDLMTNDPRIST